MKKFYLVCAALLAVAFSNVATAQDADTCANHANFVLSIGHARDNQWPEDEVVEKVTESALHSPVADDLPLMTAVIHLVYAHPKESADKLAEDFYNNCMKAVKAEQ